MFKIYLYNSWVLNLNGIDENEFPDELKLYIEEGEENEIHLGYKCRIRKRWFDVPSIYIPDAFIYRQIHRFPLLVENRARVTSTDTIHRVRYKHAVNSKLLSTVFFNSLTFA